MRSEPTTAQRCYGATRMSTIGETVRGNVGSLFGRFRPPAGLTEDEIKSIKAERLEFTQRLTAMLKLVESDGPKLVKHTRATFRELQQQPITDAMPTPDTITASVRQRCGFQEAKGFCPACTRTGGEPGIYSDTTKGAEILRGDVKYEGDWWCSGHYEILSWYANRQARFVDGLAFAYQPPTSIVPKQAFVAGADADHFAEYTDGLLLCESALFVREYLESASGESLLDTARVHA